MHSEHKFQELGVVCIDAHHFCNARTFLHNVCHFIFVVHMMRYFIVCFFFVWNVGAFDEAMSTFRHNLHILCMHRCECILHVAYELKMMMMIPNNKNSKVASAICLNMALTEFERNIWTMKRSTSKSAITTELEAYLFVSHKNAFGLKIHLNVVIALSTIFLQGNNAHLYIVTTIKTRTADGTHCACTCTKYSNKNTY